MPTEVNDLPTIRHPRTRQARFFAFSGSDIVWTAIVGISGMLTGLTIFNAGQFSLIIASFALVWVWTMAVPKKRRISERIATFNDRRYQYPIILMKELYYSIRKGVIWQASIEDLDTIEEQNIARRDGVEQVSREAANRNKKGSWKEKDRRIVKPFPLEVLKLQVDENTNIGLIYHQAKQTHSIVFKTTGSRIPSLSRIDQYYEILQFAQMISKATAAAGIKGLNIGVGIRNRPQDQWLIPEMMLEIGDVNSILPEALVTGKPIEKYTLEDKQDAFLHQLQMDYPEVTIRSCDVDMVVVATVKQNSVLRRSSVSKKMTKQEMKRLPIIRIRDVILPMLESQIGGVTVLDLEGAERYLRKARDAATLFEYYESSHQSRLHIRRTEMGLESKDQQYPEVYDRYLPNSNITVGKDYINIDGTYAGILDMTSFPANEVHAHDAPFLYDSLSRWSSMSVVGRTVSSNGEYNALNTTSSIMSDLTDVVGRIRSGPRAERKEREQSERLEDMDREGLNQDFIIRFATLATSMDDLEDEISLDFDRFINQGLEPQRVIGRSQQFSKFLTTVTMIDCES